MKIKSIFQRNSTSLFVGLCLLVVVNIQFLQAGVPDNKLIISNDIQYGQALDKQGNLQLLKLDVYRSTDDDSKKHPAIVLVHGGGFAAGDKQQELYVKMAKAFVQQGYVALSINYRLNAKRDSAYADAYTALMWINKHCDEYGIDPEKVLIGGDSAGGAIAVNTAFANPEKTKFAGCIDLWGGLSPINPAYVHTQPWDEPIFALPISANVPPTLIIHGTEDNVVPISTSRYLSEELASQGVYNELHILEGAQHYPETYAEQFIPIMLRFADKVISGRIITRKQEDVFKNQKQIILAGLSEDKDAGYKNMALIQQAAKRCQENKTDKIVFPKGIYPVSCATGDQDFEDIMTEKIPQRTLLDHTNILMALDGLKNITIDGQGSTLMFNGMVQPFDFNNCKNITILNLNIDWKRPLFSEGVVRLVKQNMLEVEIFPEYPMKGREPILSFQTFSPETGHLTGVCPFSNITSCEIVGSQLVRFSSADARLVKAGEIIVIRHMYNYKPGIRLFDCENVRVENFTIFSLPGMGVYGTRTKNISLKRYNVKPKGSRIMSGNVDATHFVSCTGTIEIDSCYFQGMGDDATNVHSYYYTIGEKLNDHSLRVFVSHSYDPGFKYREFPDVGDKIEFIRKSTLYGYNYAIIKSLNYNDSTRETTIGFDRPLPKDFSMNDLLANLSKQAKLKFTNNVVKDIRGRGILIQTSGVLVEYNSFEYCTGQGIHVDTAYPWMESNGTRNVVIRNNNFINCGYGVTGYADALAVCVETETDSPKAGIHKNLTIENNYVVGHTKPAFYLSCVDGALIKNNRIISKSTAARVEYGLNIEFTGNNFDTCKVEIGMGCPDKIIINQK